MSSEEVSFHKEIIEGLATLKQVTADILTQTTKTNGRMTRAEEEIDQHNLKFAIIDHSNAQTNWWKDKTGTAAIGIIFAILGAGLLLILQKTDILDVSVVSADQYNSLP